MRIKNLLLVISLIFLLSQNTTRAGGFPVVDITNLTQNLISATNAVQQVAHDVTQITNQVQQIQYQVQSLQTLGEGSFEQLTGNLEMQLGELDLLYRSVDGISFQLNQVQEQYNNLFPASGVANTDNYVNYFQAWQQELSDSALTAMKAQATINRISQSNMEARTILIQSKNAAGEVRQLQATNEMLSVLSHQMGEVTQTLSASGRVTATAAAVNAAEKQAQMRAKQRLIENYSDKGPPPVRYTRLP